MTTTEQKPSMRRLKRSKTDAVVMGVAGGIAEYLQVDSTVVRVIFLILVFAAGFGLLLYLLLALVMPDANSKGKSAEAFEQNARDWSKTVAEKAQELKDQFVRQHHQTRRNGRYFVGYLLLAAGVLLVLQNLGLFDFAWVGHFWPVLLIVAGFFLLVKE